MFDSNVLATSVVALNGDFDLADRSRMDNAFGAALDSSSTILLDLERTGYIGATALNCMVRLHKTAIAKGRSMVVVGPSAFALRLFKISALDRVLRIRGPLNDAEYEQVMGLGGFERIELEAQIHD